MAGAIERLEFLLSLDAKGAIKGFKDVGDTAEKELSKADAHLDKVGGNLTKFGVGALASAALVGTALVGAAGKFSELGVEVGKFSDTTGVSLDASSRWIEVSGDMGIEAGVLESSLNKMNKTAGATPDKFDAAGVAIARTKDGAVDVNATFLNTIDRLNGIKDPAERAKAATELLGKGWTGMSELIATGSDSLKTSLASVADTKVFDADKKKEAKDYRASMDTLKDSVEELVLAIGQGAAPVIGALASAIGGIVNVVGKANDVTSGFVGHLLAIGTVGLGAVGALSAVAGQAIKMRDNISKGYDALGKFGPEMLGVVGLATAFVVAYQAQETQQDRVTEATKRYTAALKAQAEGTRGAVEAQIAADFQSGSFLATMDKLGLSTREAADVVLGKSVPAYDKLKASLGKLLDSSITPTDQAVDQLGKQFGIGVGEAQGFLDRMTVLTGGVKGAKDAMEVAKQVTQELGTTAETTTKAVTYFDRSERDFKLSADAATAAVEKQKTAHDHLSSSIQETMDKMQALRDQELQGVNAKRDYEKAVDDADTAIQNYNAALGDHKSTLEDVDDAARDAEDAVIGAAQAYSLAGGAAAGSAQDIQAQIDFLTLQASTLAPNSPLRLRLEAYITDLKGIPTAIPTTISATTDFTQAFADLELLRQKARSVSVSLGKPTIGAFASGTPSAPAGAALVGENGPELVNFRGGETVTTAPQTAALLSGNGGTTIVNHNYIQTNADPNQIIQAIKRYTRNGGVL